MRHATCSPILTATFLDGKWIGPAKEEAVYPLLLYTRMASIFLEKAIGPDDDFSQQLRHANMGWKRQLFTTQPRKSKMRLIVSEFEYGLQFAVNLKAAQTFALGHNSPKGSKIFFGHVRCSRGSDGTCFWPKIWDGETF